LIDIDLTTAVVNLKFEIRQLSHRKRVVICNVYVNCRIEH